MAEHVEVNYDTLEAIAGRFANQAGEVHKMYHMMASQVDVLQGGAWIGKGADAFYAEMHNDIFPAFKRLDKAMHEGQQVMRQIIAAFKQAEEETQNVWSPF